VVRELGDVQNVQEEINCRPSTPIFPEIHEAKKDTRQRDAIHLSVSYSQLRVGYGSIQSITYAQTND